MTSPTQSQPPDAIILPDAPAIPGLGFRHFRGESDYPGIVAVGNASRMAEGLEWILSEDDIANQYSHLVNSDPAKDMIIAELDGRMIGFVRGQWNLDQEDAYRHWFHIHIEPDLQGRSIERAMLHWIEARLTEVAAEHPPEHPSTLDTFVGEDATSTTALILAEGYKMVRVFEHMSRSLAGSLPEYPLPPGFELRPVLPEHYRAIWDADREAFLDHYGYHERERKGIRNGWPTRCSSGRNCGRSPGIRKPMRLPGRFGPSLMIWKTRPRLTVRLYRIHQRSTAVSQTRSGPRPHCREFARPQGAGHDHVQPDRRLRTASPVQSDFMLTVVS
ncbi:MAG: hypothetical protein R3C44_22550 [Chloroflexota bacterium]